MVISGDLRDVEFIKTVFVKEIQFFLVIHLASANTPEESISYPIMYYDVNVSGSIHLLKVMCDNACKKIIFSSSSRVYGDETEFQSDETEELCPGTPFAKSKVLIEELLQAQCLADPEWTVAILRIFDSVGSHPSGILYKHPKSLCTMNFFENILKVALDNSMHLTFTNNGDTERDYIHVMDTASAMIEVIHAIEEYKIKGTQMISIGTGTSFSEIELVEQFQVSTGLKISHSCNSEVETFFRNQDLSTKKSLCFLNWKASYSLTDMFVHSLPMQYLVTKQYNQHCIDSIRNLCNNNLIKCDLLYRQNTTKDTEIAKNSIINAEICQIIESIGNFYKQWQYVRYNQNYETLSSVRTPATLDVRHV